MKKLSFIFYSFFLATACASAKTVSLRAGKADAFVAKNFPNADIPGDVAGKFTYGGGKIGHGECHVPAMGERSDGAVSTCKLVY